MFGHNVSIKFNKKGGSHNTICGGVVSIIIRLFLLIVLYERVMTML